MALMKCAACGREISQEADACPGCGHPVPKRTSGSTKTVAWVLGLGTGMVVLGSLSSGPAPDKPSCPATEAHCVFDPADSKLHYGCKNAIEAEAKFNARWTDNIITRPTFTRASWADDPKARVLRVFGDQVEFQNEVGNFVRTTYACDYDMQAGVVRQVVTWPGKLREQSR